MHWLDRSHCLPGAVRWCHGVGLLEEGCRGVGLLEEGCRGVGLLEEGRLEDGTRWTAPLGAAWGEVGVVPGAQDMSTWVEPLGTPGRRWGLGNDSSLFAGHSG